VVLAPQSVVEFEKQAGWFGHEGRLIFRPESIASSKGGVVAVILYQGQEHARRVIAT
jgi:hypothetical protein